jgi:hypothetical protein
MALTTFSGPVKSDNGFIGAFTSTEIVLQSDNANTITLDAPNGLAASYTLILPGNDGDNGQMLTTNGSGVTTWTTPFNPAVPGAIGSGTAAAGTFTTLAATSVGVTNTSASTSIFEPVVVSSTLTGAGVTGGRAKFATTINAAAGGFSNALKADVTYGASGSTTGLGSAFVAEMTLSAGTSAGTYAPVEIELNAATGDSTGTLTSLIHASVNGTGADSVVNANAVLVNLVGMTAGSAGDTDMVTAPGGNFAATDLTSGIGIKVKVGASFFYIPLVAAADYQDN